MFGSELDQFFVVVVVVRVEGDLSWESISRTSAWIRRNAPGLQRGSLLQLSIFPGGDGR